MICGQIITRWKAWLESQLEISRVGQTTNAAMEGLRGIAILLVFLAHYTEFNRPRPDSSDFTLWLHQFWLRAGLSGVDLFFVLSGYLIYGAIIRKPIQPFEYAKRRTKRIYPVFAFVLCLYVALFLALPSKSKLSGNLEQDSILVVLNFLLLPLLPVFGGTKTIIDASWSLAYEALYYILAPITIFTLNLRRRSANVRLALAIGLSIAGFIAFSYFGGNDRTMMFMAGVLLHEALTYTKRFSLPPWTGAIALVSGVSLVGLLYDTHGFPSTYLFCLFGVACLDAFSNDSKFGKILKNRALRQFGNMSYSFYLAHGLLLQAFFLAWKKFDPSASFYAPILPSLIFCTMGSLALYLTIEKPFSLQRPGNPPTQWKIKDRKPASSESGAA